METKICIECNIEKPVSEFYKRNDTPSGYRNNCKECKLKNNHKWRKENKEKVVNIGKIWREKNKENIRKRIKEWEIKNYRKIRDRKNKKTKERRKKDPVYHMMNKVRCRLRKYLITLNITKKNKTFDIVGCTPQELKEYLEKKFINGMTWENRSEWHIDHIIPLSSAKTEEELYKLCHYTNLQPLWAEENMKKGNKILEPLNENKE
jgi:hypothetical protein